MKSMMKRWSLVLGQICLLFLLLVSFGLWKQNATTNKNIFLVQQIWLPVVSLPIFVSYESKAKRMRVINSYKSDKPWEAVFNIISKILHKNSLYPLKFYLKEYIFHQSAKVYREEFQETKSGSSLTFRTTNLYRIWNNFPSFSLILKNQAKNFLATW